MSPSHLGKLFGALGLILTIVCVNTWLASQGAMAILKIPLLHEDRAAMSFLAMVVGCPLLIVLSLVGQLHAMRHGQKWHSRVPIVWLDELDTGSAEGKAYQATILALFLALPIAAFIHFFRIVFGDSYLCVDGGSQYAEVWDAWFKGLPNSGNNQIRLVATGAGTCVDGIEVFPGWEFVILILLIIGAAVAVVSFLRAVVWGRWRL